MINKISGFTLIELLVVISIIGVLAALLLANMAGIRQRADDVKLKNKLKQFDIALRGYYNDNQKYPETGGPQNAIAITGPGSIYMESPMTELKYYNRLQTGNTFDSVVSCVNLQNKGDKEIQASQNKCFNGHVDAPELASFGCPVESCYCVCTF